MNNSVASRYAQALFDVAKQNDMVGAVNSDLETIVRLLKTDARFSDFLNNPSQKRDDKNKLFDSVFGDRITGITMQLLKLMLEKRRETMIGDVHEAFTSLRREAEGIAYAHITSAKPLSEAEQKAIVAKLEKSGGKKIEADFEVDASLIGGVRAQIGNHVLDGSVRGSLNRMKDRLLYDVLKQI